MIVHEMRPYRDYSKSNKKYGCVEEATSNLTKSRRDGNICLICLAFDNWLTSSVFVETNTVVSSDFVQVATQENKQSMALTGLGFETREVSPPYEREIGGRALTTEEE
ncbi:hypothetical protein F2Q69_00003769 [Brassica cretica]|uniref:Uncharacterized protein n=1 Tax=Brassica cretica TaxID=69181 RepID=A0A8S9P523_BRACR|nr:hypothetical protein F2Q69_00003769 [Brassica cretica]